jgi:hypothetical protein
MISAMPSPPPAEPTPTPTDDRDEVVLVARGIASAVAPEDGLTDVQAALLGAIAEALTGFNVDYHDLDPLTAQELAEVLAEKPEWYRQRSVHHMVLGELVLKPLPHEVALRVQQYTAALGIQDKFVRIAHRYAQGATGLAWIDLQRSGFTAHLEQADPTQDHYQSAGTPFEKPPPAPEVVEKWRAFEDFPADSLGRKAWEMYDARGFALPGTPEGASPYLAQHDFVHVLADYGTNLKGELEVFALIGRANPDPQGFAWLATLVGLFETGYVEDTGFFERDVREHNIQAPGMHVRIADAIRRGKRMSECCERDPFELDFHAVADRPVAEVCELFGIQPKSAGALESGSPGVFDREGMSAIQQAYFDQRAGGSR